MNNRVRLARLALPVLLGLSGIAPVATAQTAQAPSDQVIQLDEFQVSSRSNNAYVASETMSGTRTNTKIIDLPFSIVNLTNEFFNDFNIQILDENMTYIGGLTNLGIGGAFNLRGFASTSQLKDGFYRLGRYGLSNIDRIEVIRGPQAAIYGRSSPGGMVNFVSLQPSKKVEQSFSYSYGSYDNAKANLKLTGTLNESGSTYYVVDLNQTDAAYFGDYSHIRNSEVYSAIEHDFSSSSRLKFSAEYFLQVQHSPAAGAPLLFATRAATPDNTATSTLVGYDIPLAAYNAEGPNSELNRGSTTITGTYDKRFSDHWSTRVGGYFFKALRWDYNQNTGWGSVTLPADGGASTPVTDTRGSLPSRGEIFEAGGGFQADLSGHYSFMHGKIESNSLVTVDLNDYYRYDPTFEFGPNSDPTLQAWNAATSGRVVSLIPGSIHGVSGWIPSGPISYFPAWFNPAEVEIFNPATGNAITGGPSQNGGSVTRHRATSLGGNLREQLIFWDGKLITYLGLRNDTVRFSERSYTANFASVGFPDLPAGTGGSGQPGGSVLRRYVHENKPNMGFNAEVLKNFHVYGSYSTAYFVDQTAAPTLVASSFYAPFTAKGYDYGIKGSFLDERLNFTVGGYYNRMYNVVTTEVVETTPGNYVTQAAADGDQLSTGVETDLSYIVTPDFTFGASYGTVNSRYTYYGADFPEAVGRPVSGQTPGNGSAYMKYSVNHGALQGLFVNLMATHAEATPSQAPNAGYTTALNKTTGLVTVTAHTDQYKARIPGYQTFNFGIHYTIPTSITGPKWIQRVDLNVNNLFNKFYLKTNGQLGMGRQILLQYTINHEGYKY